MGKGIYADRNWYKKPLIMPIGEIVSEYRQAKFPGKMIQTLTELNSTSGSRISWILLRCGLKVPPGYQPKPPQGEGRANHMDYWAASPDAAECDRLREQLEMVEAEREAAARAAAQSMDGWDTPTETEDTPTENGEEEQGKEECKMFESEDHVIRRMLEEAAAEAEGCWEDDYYRRQIPSETETENQESPAAEGADRRRAILTDAAVCVCTDRNLLYGEPESSFAQIADLWSAYLGIVVTERMAADMMILFKLARARTALLPHRDTYVDMAGYAAIAGAMEEVDG